MTAPVADARPSHQRDLQAEADEIEARVGQAIATSRTPQPASLGDGADDAEQTRPTADQPAGAASKHILLGPALANPQRYQSRLGIMLLDADLISRQELARALERQNATGERLGEALVAIGAVCGADVARVLAQHLRLPFIDLADGVSDPTLIRTISEEVARRYVVLPVARWDDRIVMAMANPNDPDMIDELELLTNAPIVAAVADPIALRNMIAAVYGDPATLTDTPTPLPGPTPAREQAAPNSEPITTMAFACPGCHQQLTLRGTPRVMMELNHDPGRYYIWEHEPGDSKPAHTCHPT